MRLAHKKSGEQALGRTQGGLGNTLRFTLSGGHRHDLTQAYQLLEGFDFKQVIADRGY